MMFKRLDYHEIYLYIIFMQNCENVHDKDVQQKNIRKWENQVMKSCTIFSNFTLGAKSTGAIPTAHPK